ncbi:unnamed protein product [Nesidiocoris tenuis]|uniref:Uncharacterized protein n=1 Tax=Nesidiocoris tenuis TaxID=355587 RepID=A0A6H5HA18_9HEMI|nr:unnamed protein product [Nesidiocoris tenuis]
MVLPLTQKFRNFSGQVGRHCFHSQQPHICWSLGPRAGPGPLGPRAPGILPPLPPPLDGPVETQNTDSKSEGPITLYVRVSMDGTATPSIGQIRKGHHGVDVQGDTGALAFISGRNRGLIGVNVGTLLSHGGGSRPRQLRL